MIRFYAQMYDATSDTLIDATPKVYSIGYYKGYIDPESEMGADILQFKDGQIINTLPQSAISFDSITNIGCKFAEVAKQIHTDTGEWHVLRLLKTSSTNDNYMEWSVGSATGFTIKVDGAYSRWGSCMQWSDSQPYECIVFIKADSINELLSQDIHYSGGYLLHIPSVEGGTTIVGDSSGNFECDLPKYSSTKTAFDQNFTLTSNRTYTYKAAARVTDDPFEYYIALIESVKDATTDWSIQCYVFSQTDPGNKLIFDYIDENTPGSSQLRYLSEWNCYYEYQRIAAGSSDINLRAIPFEVKDISPITTNTRIKTVQEALAFLSSNYNFHFTLTAKYIYDYLIKNGSVTPDEPGTDVDPEDIPPEDTPPDPTPPDDQDPYYDPTSDPTNPDYDPTKDPTNPQYDPTEPHTPYRPPSQPSDPPTQEEHPPQDPIPTPETPPSYVTTNAMFTLYNPSGGDLTNLANFLWSPTWSIDTFKKIFANPLDCILGLMVMPHLSASVSTKTMYVGNISTGVTMHYFTKQFYDFDCGTFELMEYYNSYLDYAPYTKVNIFLPYIGDKQLSTDEVMNKTLGVKYRFDLATGDCVAFVTVNGTVLYSFSGNCAARLPLAGNNWNGIIPAITGVAISAGSMAAGLPALGAASAAAVSTMKETISHTGSISGSAGLMGIQTPYLIVTRPRQALPLGQNSFTGYPSFITESLGSLKGYTEVEQCHLEHVPATGAELEEIERLLKEGVLF